MGELLDHPSYRCVVAEDDADVRDMLITVLESWGFDVFAAKNGEEGLAALRSSTPDVALLDLQMPGMGGLDVVRAMRADDQLRKVPAIVVTAQSNGESAVDVLAAGADDYVRKPFHTGELRERVMHLACRTREVRRLAALEEAIALPGAITDLPGLRVAGLSRPALGAISGGDFMAVVPGPGGLVTAIVGDVEGHGLPAAGLASFARAALANVATYATDPDRILQMGSWMMTQRETDPDGPHLVTATCMVLDPETGETTFAMAGNPAPFFLGGGAPIEYDGGPPLGLPDHHEFPVHRRVLAPGERVLVFTDGLMAAQYGQADFTEAVLPWLSLRTQELNLRQTLELVESDHREFARGGRPDDVSLLLLERAPLYLPAQVIRPA